MKKYLAIILVALFSACSSVQMSESLQGLKPIKNVGVFIRTNNTICYSFTGITIFNNKANAFENMIDHKAMLFETISEVMSNEGAQVTEITKSELSHPNDRFLQLSDWDNSSKIHEDQLDSFTALSKKYDLIFVVDGREELTNSKGEINCAINIEWGRGYDFRGGSNLRGPIVRVYAPNKPKAIGNLYFFSNGKFVKPDSKTEITDSYIKRFEPAYRQMLKTNLIQMLNE